MDVQLSIRGITKRYPSGDGVSDFSLDVRKNELVTLLGPSGCGKTTVLRTIGGFLEPDRGEILVEGKSVVHLPPEKRPSAMVFQSYNLWPHMTVYENLAFGLRLRKMRKKDIQLAVERGLQLVRLPDAGKKYPSQLSGGQQQRVALARALLLEPAVLLLDEPFSALDARLRMEMREELREIQAKVGMTMVFVTHDQEEALAISDHIVVMNAGHIEQIGTPTEIYDSPATEFVARFIGHMNFVQAFAKDGAISAQGFHIIDDTTGLQGEVLAAVRPEDIVFHSESSGIQATIRQTLVLGYYTEIMLDSSIGPLKAFGTRELSKALDIGARVGIRFKRVTAYKK